jgi:WD40 repeat protein
MPTVCLRLAILAALTIVAAGAVRAGEPAARPRPRLDRFGDPLPAGALFRIGTTRLQLNDDVQAIAVSPDGALVAAASRDTVGIWASASGREVDRFPHGARGAHFPGFFAFAPDGKSLACNGDDHLNLYWALGTRGICHELGGRALCGVFAADGKNVKVVQETDGGGNVAIRQWDISTRKLVHEWKPPPALARDSSTWLSHDGKTLATMVPHGDKREAVLRHMTSPPAPNFGAGTSPTR